MNTTVIQNTIKYTNKNGMTTGNVKSTDDKVLTFEVCDKGLDMNKKTINKIIDCKIQDSKTGTSG